MEKNSSKNEADNALFTMVMVFVGLIFLAFIIAATAKWIVLIVLGLPFSLALNQTVKESSKDRAHNLGCIAFSFVGLSLLLIGVPSLFTGQLFSGGVFQGFIEKIGGSINVLIGQFVAVFPNNPSLDKKFFIKSIDSSSAFKFYYTYYLGTIIASFCLFQVVRWVKGNNKKSDMELENPRDKRGALFSFLDLFYYPYMYLFLKPYRFVKHNIMNKNVQEPELKPISFKKHSGVYIGRQWHTNRKVFLTPENLNLHTQIIGGSGAGKSNLIKLISEQRVGEGLGLIILDFKQDFGTFEWITGLCQNTGRLEDLKVFTASQNEMSRGYNPVAWGTASQIKSRIMGSLDISEDGAGKHYKDQADGHLLNILEALTEIRDISGEQITLQEIYECLNNVDYLEALTLRKEVSGYCREELLRTVERLKTKEGTKEITSVTTALRSVIKSAAGPLLVGQKCLDEENRIDLKKDINESNILYVLMDSMSDFQTSKIMGRFFLQDLISTVADINSKKRTGHDNSMLSQVIIDEFASFATPNFTELIAKARSAGVGIAVAHQSRDDLNEISETFSKRIEDNCATKLIFRTNSAENAEYFANSIGTQKTTKETRATSSNLLGRMETEAGSIREVDSYIIHPNIFKNLRTGQLIKISGLRDAESVALDIDLATDFHSEDFQRTLEESTKAELFQKRINIKLIKEKNTNKKEPQSKLEDSGVFL